MLLGDFFDLLYNMLRKHRVEQFLVRHLISGLLPSHNYENKTD